MGGDLRCGQADIADQVVFGHGGWAEQTKDTAGNLIGRVERKILLNGLRRAGFRDGVKAVEHVLGRTDQRGPVAESGRCILRRGGSHRAARNGHDVPAKFGGIPRGDEGP